MIIFIYTSCRSVWNSTLFKRIFIIFSSKEFHESFYYVPMILVGVLASSMTLLYSTVITAREKTKISSIISIVGGLLV